jgi:iron complex outermembrane receptor protein
MKRLIPLSLIAVASIYASDIELESISVESTQITEVAQNAKVSADLAQTLSLRVPSIDMSRRSTIANDIFIRGQKRDNISIEVDGTKVYGACANRMDPPTSHILTSQIKDIKIIEGPYDVETFGVMSGGVKITTKKPTKELHGEVNLGYGSWNYTKVGATLSGGNDIIRVLISASSETSDQYKDGNSDTLVEQNAKKATLAGNRYKTQFEDMKAYEKKSMMTKAFVNITDEQELQLSYMANRSKDILYPNTPMDATRGDSNIYSITYNINNISDRYKNINLEYYYSDVNHPMSTYYKNSSNNPLTDITNHMYSTMQGVKLKNNFDIDGLKLLFGLDSSKRTWRGKYYNTTTGVYKGDSISDTVTYNNAIFAKADKKLGYLNVSFGMRYDDTVIKSDDVVAIKDRDFDTFNANIFTFYNLDENNKVFFGFGQASRVPDARELYFRKNSNLIGTPTLDKTTNRQFDLGYELQADMFEFKIKLFYSVLEDFIYTNKDKNTNKFENIDATIYGGELSASVYATDELTIDMGVSYKRGQKDKPLNGQSDKDLADMAPLRGNIVANYEYMANSFVTAEIQASDKWSDYDEDNGEQEINAWSIVNLKVKHAINKSFDFTLGVNNLFDETYAQSNTYADLILIQSGASDTMLLNEMGRYVYTNLDFRF